MRRNLIRACLVACCLVMLLPGLVRSPTVRGAQVAATHEVGPVSSLRFSGAVLYAGTETGGLFRIEPGGDPTPAPVFPGGPAIRSLAVDGRGIVWAGTEGGGLGAYDGANWTLHTPENSSFPSMNVRGVDLDDRDGVWAATDAGLASLRDGEWTVYNSGNSPLISDDLTAVIAGYDIWFGSPTGLTRLYGSVWTTYQTGNSGLPDNHILALARNDGAVWVGTESGLARTTGSDWKSSPDVPGPVTGIAADAAGDLWLDLSGTVARWSGCDWQPDAVGNQVGRVSALAIGPGEEVWVGTETGVRRLEARAEQGVWSALPLKQPVRALVQADREVWTGSQGQAIEWSLPDLKQTRYGGLRGEPRAAIVDSEGSPWVATWGEGIARWNDGQWDYLTAEDSGLPSNYVATLALDARGRVWAGTAEGIMRWDSDRPDVYAPSVAGLGAGTVVALAAGRDGRVWAGSYGGGLTVYDPAGEQWQGFNTENSGIPSEYIQSLSVAGDGLLWIGTAGAGAVLFDGDRFQTFRAGPGGPADDFVAALASDSDGRIWAAGEKGGLAEFDGCRWTHFRPEGLDVSVNALAAIEGALWVGTDRGLLSLQPPERAETTAPAPLAVGPLETPVRAALPKRPSVQAQSDEDRWINYPVGRSVHAIAPDGQFVWAATMNGGAIRWNPEDETFARFVYPQDGIGSNRVVFVQTDSQERVWFGTQDRGVSIYDGRTWTVYHTANSPLPNDYVNGVAFDSSGRAWLATLGGGVCVFDGEGYTTYNKDNSELAGDWVWYVAVDAKDRVWAGTMDGLSYFDGEGWTTVPDTSNVHCVTFGEDGTVWFGDSDGLNRVENGRAVELQGDTRVWTKDVYSIAFDADGAAWLGAQNGIFRYQDGAFSQVSLSTTGLQGNQVFAVTADSAGRVWVGTDREDGLAFFDGDSWRTFHTVNGPNPAGTGIRDVFEDGQGRLWFSTDGGASVFDGRAWVAYTSRNSGLLSNSVNVIRQDTKERMWIGTDAGLNILDGDTWEAFTSKTSGLPDDQLQAIEFDKQGRAWIGSRQGVTTFDGLHWEAQAVQVDGQPFDSIIDIVFDHSGRLWLVSSSWPDVVVLDRGRVRRYNRDEFGLKTFSLSSLEVDPRGRVWLGSFDGVSMFDGSRWRALPTTGRGLTVSSAYSLAFDSKGTVWSGGYGGLLRLEGNTWSEYLYGKTPLASEFVSAVAVDSRDHVWIGTSWGGVSELIPGPNAPPPPPTPTVTPTFTPTAYPTPEPPPAAPTQPPPPPAPTAAAAIAPQAPAPLFARIWEEVYGGDRGGMQWAVNEARRIWCAEQRYEHGLMFWRNNEPEPGTVYVLTYAGGDGDNGQWRSFPDTWDSSQPAGGGFTPPPGLLEPVRGFGKVWREQLGGPEAPAIGWATELEQGSDQSTYQDFRGGTMLYSPNLNKIFVLKLDGNWRSFAGQ